MGIGDWGLGIGDWGFGPKPQTQKPKPPNYYFILKYKLKKKKK